MNSHASTPELLQPLEFQVVEAHQVWQCWEGGMEGGRK